MATCQVCPPDDNDVPDEIVLEHVRLMHPELYGDGPQRWPDGAPVVVDPADFDPEPGS